MRRLIAYGALLSLLVAAPALADENWDNGVAAYTAGNYSAAAAAFKAYVELVPDAYQGHQMLGQSQLKAKQYAEAAASFQKANELKPGDANLQLALAQALASGGKGRDACAAIGKINESALPAANKQVLYSLRMNHCGSSLADLAKMAQAQPDDATVQAAYGAAAFEDGQVAVAVTALEKAIRLAPNDAKIRSTYVKVLIHQARSAQGAAKQAAYTKAVTAADQLVKVDRTYDNVLRLGEVQLGAKQYSQAVTTLQSAAGMKPNEWLPSFYLGQALTSLNRYDEAVPPLNKALGIADAESKRNVYRQLGFVHEKQKNYAESIRNYELAGDQGSVARVRANQETEQFNQNVEEQNELLDELKREQEKLERELQGLEEPPR